MSLKPRSVSDFFHKISSVAAVVLGVASGAPDFNDWKSLAIWLVVSLSGAGLVGSSVKSAVGDNS